MSFLPYARQEIDQADIDAVVEVLRSDWLTTGPAVERFEEAVADFVGLRHAVAVSSGTAALHAAVHAMGISAGDEVILSPLTFVATANAILYQGGVPVFADVEEGSLLLDPEQVAKKITPRTRAVIAVDYAGQPCDYQRLRALCGTHGVPLLADCCHSLGGRYHEEPVGRQADLSVFSFHPVKPMTTGEGGMIVTDRPDVAERLRRFRNHGIDTDHRQRSCLQRWQYEMVELGFNYRLTDLQAALGCSQLGRLERWVAARRRLAQLYAAQLAELPRVSLLEQHAGRDSSWHLLVVRVPGDLRDQLFSALRQQGIGANVHYELVYRHPYYRRRFGSQEGCCPVAERAAAQILSLPLYPAMGDEQVVMVSHAVREFFAGGRS